MGAGAEPHVCRHMGKLNRRERARSVAIVTAEGLLERKRAKLARRVRKREDKELIDGEQAVAREVGGVKPLLDLGGRPIAAHARRDDCEELLEVELLLLACVILGKVLGVAEHAANDLLADLKVTFQVQTHRIPGAHGWRNVRLTVALWRNSSLGRARGGARCGAYGIPNTRKQLWAKGWARRRSRC